MTPTLSIEAELEAALASRDDATYVAFHYYPDLPDESRFGVGLHVRAVVYSAHGATVDQALSAALDKPGFDTDAARKIVA